MARIGTYPLDTSIQNDDKFLGTDGSTGATKNFPPSSISKYLNETASVGINRQTSLRFTTRQSEEFHTHGGMYIPEGMGDLDMSTITQIAVSIYNFSLSRHLQLFNYAVGNKIFLFSFNDLEAFANYKVLSLEPHPENANYRLVNLQYIEGQGKLEDTTVYGLAVNPNDSDKTYSTGSMFHNASDTWKIKHNLGKIPSVTITSYDTNEQVEAQVTHHDENNLTITFAEPFAGTAILN